MIGPQGNFNDSKTNITVAEDDKNNKTKEPEYEKGDRNDSEKEIEKEDKEEVKKLMESIKAEIEEDFSVGDGKIDDDGASTGWKVFHKIGGNDLLFPLEESFKLSYDVYSYSDYKTDTQRVNKLIDRTTNVLKGMGFTEYAERDGYGHSKWKYYRNEAGFICGFDMNSGIDSSAAWWAVLCANESWSNSYGEELAVELVKAYDKDHDDEINFVTEVYGGYSDETGFGNATLYVLGRYYEFYKKDSDSEWVYAYEFGEGAVLPCSLISDEAKEFFPGIECRSDDGEMIKL